MGEKFLTNPKEVKGMVPEDVLDGRPDLAYVHPQKRKKSQEDKKEKQPPKTEII